MRVRTDEDSRWYQFFTFFFFTFIIILFRKGKPSAGFHPHQIHWRGSGTKPVCEQAPWMHLIEDLISEKVSRHLSQAIVELYELSHFEVRSDASLL